MKDNKSDFADNVVDTISAKGSAVYKSAKKTFDSSTGEATEALGDVRDKFVDALDTAIEDRPYTTLALALGAGFVMGAMWRR